MAYGKKNKVSAKEKVSRLHMNTTLSINTTIEMMKAWNKRVSDDK